MKLTNSRWLTKYITHVTYQFQQSIGPSVSAVGISVNFHIHASLERLFLKGPPVSKQ